jgi:hypothetical protein
MAMRNFSVSIPGIIGMLFGGMITLVLMVIFSWMVIVGVVSSLFDPTNVFGIGDKEQEIISQAKQANFEITFDGYVTKTHGGVKGMIPGVKRYFVKMNEGGDGVYLYFDSTGYLIGNYGQRYW